MAPADDAGSVLARWRGVLGLAGRRLLRRTDNGLFNRVTVTVLVVAVTVALLVVVTGVSAGLASESTVRSDAVDYWVVPESANTLTSVVSVQGPQLGDVHRRTDEIRSIAGVTAATPVLVEVLRIRAENGERPEFVLAIGVIPGEAPARVAGVPTSGLAPGDPHYSDGSYDGPVTGEVALSGAAADLLNASAGDDLTVGSPATGTVAYSEYSVAAVSEPGAQSPRGSLPVAVVHLSELQSLSGAADGDGADQFLVQTNSPGVRSELQGTYPGTTVVSRGGLNPEPILSSDLPLAISGTALLVVVVIGTLFVATTMGLEAEADRQFLAVLAALGLSKRTRLAVVAGTTLGLAAVGGVVGVGLAAVSAAALNWLLTTQFSLPAVMRLHPLLGVYGIGVAILMGLFALPYPLRVASETATSRELRR